MKSDLTTLTFLQALLCPFIMSLLEDPRAAASVIDVVWLATKVFHCLGIFNVDLRPLYDHIPMGIIFGGSVGV